MAVDASEALIERVQVLTAQLEEVAGSPGARARG